MCAARILIVDDEQPIAETLSLILCHAGYETFTASNGQSGLETALQVQPNLVLSDISMPGMDGVSMAMAIRATLPGVAVLLFSGQAMLQDLLRSAEQNGFHFEVLPKPTPPGDLLREVAFMLAQSKQEPAL